MTDFLVKNEMTGLWNSVAADVYLTYNAYFEARKAFEHYAKYQHNPNSLPSAEVYMGLMKIMDEAKKRCRPYANAWCIATKGYSLN